MTVNNTTSSEMEEAIESEETHLFGDEKESGIVAGEVFFEPEQAAVELQPAGEDLIRLSIREATYGKGVSMSWMITPEEAREFSKDMLELLDEMGEMESPNREIED